MKVKVVFGSDIRRWHAPEENRYEALIDFIQNTFNFPDAGKFFLQYDDDEGDKITISSSNELGEAFASAEQDGRKSLKIFLIPVSIHEARQDALSHFKSSRSVSGDQFDVQSNSHADSACVDRDSDFEPESPFDQEECGPRTWQEDMTDFFADEAVNALLPDFVRGVLSILRMEQDAGLDIAILQTSSRDQFEAIAQHSFFQNHVEPNLETISLRATSLLPVLLAFDDDHIASIIPQLTETAIQMLSGVPDAELDVTPIFATLFPTWMAMMNANNPAGGSVNLMDIFGCGNAAEAAATMMGGMERKDDDVVHNDVTCDMCNVCPIRGARFKCAVCTNFDLCSMCEATGTHNREHPLLKLSRPCRNGLPRARMHGLRELLGGRGRCGGWRKWHQGPENMHHPFAPPPPHGHHGHPFPPPPPFGGPLPHHPHPHPHGPPGHHGPFGHHGPWRQWGRFGQNFGQGPPCGTQAPPAPETDTSSVCSEATVRTEGGRKLKACFIEDVNIPDRSHYRPGLVLEKVWKMQNSGPSAWGDSCSLVFVKGCRTMTMEERFPVPNAQPGETVQVAAMIRTPDEANRYCAYYRLERDGSKFGPRVWVDIFVTEDESKLGESKVSKAQSKQMRRVEKLQKEQEKLAARQAKVQEKLNRVNEQIEVSQQPEGPSLSCMCGSNLMKVHHKKAYRVNARINCDICGKLAKKNDQIYHCPNELSPLHPGGYDLCEGCGQDQFARKVEEAPVDQEEEQVPPPSAHAVEIEQSNPSPAVIPSAPPVEHSAEESGFPFQEALNTVMQMGFGDEEHVKFLLMECEGNVENVVQHILSSA